MQNVNKIIRSCFKATFCVLVYAAFCALLSSNEFLNIKPIENKKVFVCLQIDDT